MIEPLVGLLTLLIEASSKITKSHKRKLGKELARLFVELKEIVRCGHHILDELEEIRPLKKTQREEGNYGRILMTYLFSQAKAIERVQAIIKKSSIETILKIHLPELKDLQILLDMKSKRIALLARRLKSQKLKKFEPVTLVNPTASQYKMLLSQSSELKFMLPTESSLRRSRQDLYKIDLLTIELRKFLEGTFDIDEIV